MNGGHHTYAQCCACVNCIVKEKRKNISTLRLAWTFIVVIVEALTRGKMDVGSPLLSCSSTSLSLSVRTRSPSLLAGDEKNKSNGHSHRQQQQR